MRYLLILSSESELNRDVSVFNPKREKITKKNLKKKEKIIKKFVGGGGGAVTPPSPLPLNPPLIAT